MRIVLSVALIILNFGAQGQEELENYLKKYPGMPIVQTYKEKTITIDRKDNELDITAKITEDHFILTNEGASMLLEDEIFYSSFEELESVKAYSYSTTGKSSKKVKATNFSTQDAEQEDHVFHDDNTTTTFMYPGLEKGSVRHLDYELKYNEHRFPYGFHFFAYFPLENAIFRIDHDTSLHLIKYDYNMDGYNIRFEEEVVKDRRIWTWTCEENPELRFDSYSPRPQYFLPGTYAQISHYFNDEGEKTTVLGSLDDLVQWYSTNVDEVLSEEPNQELIDITNEIVNDKSNEFDKVRAIYYWVQDNIKYIAFEDGMGGLVPRRANKVCEKRFGDCKDKAVLVYQMMKIAGIDGKIVWIGTKSIPFKYSDFPSTAIDNHMIAAYEKDGKTYFLDATSDLQPIELPAYAIQNKEALIYGGRDNYRLEIVPTPKQNDTQLSDKVKIRIDDRKISGQANSSIDGYYNWIVRNDMQRMNELSDIKKVEAFWDFGNNSFNVTSAKIDMDQDREAPLNVTFDFEVDNYAVSLDNEVFVNLILSKDICKEKELKEDRKSPFTMDFHSLDTYEVTLEVPEGMSVKSVPEMITYDSEKISFSVEYTVEDRQVKMQLKNAFRFLQLQPEEFHLWNDYIKQVNKALNSSVVLTKDK